MSGGGGSKASFNVILQGEFERRQAHLVGKEHKALPEMRKLEPLSLEQLTGQDNKSSETRVEDFSIPLVT